MRHLFVQLAELVSKLSELPRWRTGEAKTAQTRGRCRGTVTEDKLFLTGRAPSASRNKIGFYLFLCSVLKPTLGIFLAIAMLFAPFSFLGNTSVPPVEADVQDALETGAVGCAISALIGLGLSYASGNSVPVNDIPGLIKEYALDCAGWVLGDVAIAIITTEMIGWINEGFDGAPAYVQSLARYYQETIDNEFGAFLESTSFGEHLCEPFRLDIELALTLDLGLPPLQRSSCTLTDIFENIQDYDDFISGDFSKGGWDGWFNITTNPQNNPYGVYLIVQEEWDARANSALDRKRSEYDAGQGFKGFEIQNCYETTEVSEGGVEVTYQECDPPETVTPGSAIKSALDGSLDLANKRLANADELQEVLNRIVSSLVLDAFTKEGGLKGYDYNEASGLDLPEIDPGIGGGGGSGPGWNCLVDLESWGPATERVVWNGGNHTTEREAGISGGFGYKLRIPGVAPGKYYRSATFDFDLHINEINSVVRGEFDSIMDFARDRITGTYAGYWGVGISNRIDTYIDFHGGEYFKNRTPWGEQNRHHVTITQNAEAGTVNIRVVNLFNNEVIGNLTYSHEGMDIIDADGNGLFVYLGEHPGWRYENLTVTLEPGGPFQGGVRGPCAPGGDDNPVPDRE